MNHRDRPRPENDVAYARGAGTRAKNVRPLTGLERLTLAHVGIHLLAMTWAFGGAADWVRTPLAWWGSLGVLITLWQLQDRAAWAEGWMRPLTWLWPLVAFNALVLVACLNPNLHAFQFEGETLLGKSGGNPHWPSSARPGLALQLLWWFDAIWISAFNVAFVLRQRRALRGLLLFAVLNALALAVFGTIQRLARAKGIYFGAVKTPQVHFFSTFVYHNHWGAFVVLMMAACLGLVWHYARRSEARDFFHSPAFGGLAALLLLAVTAPLSTSRSCTLLTVVLLSGAFVHWIVRLVRQRRRFRESIVLPLLGACAGIALATGGIWFIARDSITARVAKTREQLEEMRAQGSIGARGQLYRDTWRMARDKPWFGWGMASYPHVFTFYNTQEHVDRLPVFYHDAHSDWLQSLAEHGFVGSALLALCAIVPLLRLRARHFRSAIPTYLLAGCGLVLLYAWVEFPFGNLAVVFVWWLCFFGAVQYARLQDRETSSPDQSSPARPA